MPNPGPMGSAYVILDEHRNKLHEGSVGAAMGTNNQAEYIAVMAAVEKLKTLDPSRVTVYSDSKLVINQIAGKWKVNKADLRVYRDTIVSELRGMGVDCEFVHVRAHQGDHYNEYVDQLAKAACPI